MDGSFQEVLSLAAAIADFYVYVIFRINGAPCYIGKGRGKRWLRHARNTHNLHLRRIFAQAGGALPMLKIREGLTEAQAFEIEVALIAAIGREANGGPLVNRTDGGEGGTGARWSEESREKKRIWFQTQDHTKREEARLKVLQSPEHSAKMSALQKGKPKSLQGKANIAKGHRRGPPSPETIEKVRAWHLGKKRSIESRANMSAARRKHMLEHGHPRLGKRHSAETRANIAAHTRIQFARKRWEADCPISEFARWGDGASAGWIA